MGDISVRLSPAGMRVMRDIDEALARHSGPLGRGASINTGIVIGGMWLQSGGGTRVFYRKARAGESTTVTRGASLTIKGIVALAAGDNGQYSQAEIALFNAIGESLGV